MSGVMIAGCGYLGTALGLRMAAEGRRVYGLRRDPSGLPAEIEPVAADLLDPRTLQSLPATKTVVYAASASDRSEESYRAAYVEGPRGLLRELELRRSGLRRFLFVSSTAVYAQRRGEWVDEDSATRPENFSGRLLLEGERLVLGARASACVLRLGGIYGPGRATMIRRVRRGEARYPARPPIYGNRVHRDDAAGILAHLILAGDCRPIYLGVDDDPAPLQNVVAWLATQCDVPLPAPPANLPAGSRLTRSNKRCRNDRIRSEGYRFRFPTFREGYTSLL